MLALLIGCMMTPEEYAQQYMVASCEAANICVEADPADYEDYCAALPPAPVCRDDFFNAGAASECLSALASPSCGDEAEPACTKVCVVPDPLFGG